MFLDGAFETAREKGETCARESSTSASPLSFCSLTLTKRRISVAPEVTEGPYYHTEGHPIRQNMAEDQLGLLFVSFLL